MLWKPLPLGKNSWTFPFVFFSPQRSPVRPRRSLAKLRCRFYEESVTSTTSYLEAMPNFSARHLSSAHGGGLTDGLQHSLQVVDHLSVEQVDNAMGVGGIVL